MLKTEHADKSLNELEMSLKYGKVIFVCQSKKAVDVVADRINHLKGFEGVSFLTPDNIKKHEVIRDGVYILYSNWFRENNNLQFVMKNQHLLYRVIDFIYPDIKEFD